MAKTDATRQAEYRRQHLTDENGQGERRRGYQCSCKTGARTSGCCYCVTQRAMIERVLLEAEYLAAEQASQHAGDYYDKRKRHAV